MLKSKNPLILLFVCLAFYACVEPFKLDVQQERKILTIDATITDLAEEQTVKITESWSGSNSVYSIPVANAKVEIIINDTEQVALTEQSPGVYVLPVSFHTRKGDRYRLSFLKEGVRYESAEERQSEVSDITRVYDEFRLDGIETALGYDPAHYIYLDTQDPANEKNNYLWSWKLWERQSICATCENGRFFNTPYPGLCKIEPAFSNVTYDYNCLGQCWQIFYNKDLNVASDMYSDGKLITGRLIGKIPYYSIQGALLEVKQQSISTDAYQYLKLLANQVQNNGSLVDTPPAAIIGNVKNTTKSDEPVAGFFMVTSVRTVRYWLGREEAVGLARPLGLLGRPISLEPSSGDVRRPPLAPCLEEKYRTALKPQGWVD